MSEKYLEREGEGEGEGGEPKGVASRKRERPRASEERIDEIGSDRDRARAGGTLFVLQRTISSRSRGASVCFETTLVDSLLFVRIEQKI